MKWFLVPVTVFLGALVLFFSIPSSVLTGTQEVMQHSLDNLVAVFRPVMDRATERAEPVTDKVRGRAESPRPQTFRTDRPVMDRATERAEPVTDKVRGRVESPRPQTFRTDRPVMDRAAERAEPVTDKVRGRVESPRPQTFGTDRPVMDRAAERAEPVTDKVRGRVESPRPQTFGTELSGIARVLDGDTIEIGTDRIRLWGVDAPEGRQTCLEGSSRWPCGRRATQALAGRIDGRSVACEERDRDGRIVAVCRHGGRDINAWLVREGWALAFRRYSQAYVNEESVAKAARRGLWRGEFVRPWDWRRGKRLQTAHRDDRRVSSRDRGACNIKGNISRNSGRRIYHVPGDPDYARTRISTSHGERWFCTESEARAAGWRRYGR